MAYDYHFNIFKLFWIETRKTEHMVSLNFVFLSLALFYLKAFISIGFCFHAFESILRHFTIIFLQIYTTEIWMCHYINLKHHQTICCVHLFHFIVYVGINTRREKINKLHIFLNQRYITPQGKKKKKNPPTGLCCILFSTIIFLSEFMYLISILSNRNWSIYSNLQE